MKNIILLIAISVCLFSCSKEKESLKVIEPLFFLANKPVIRKSDTLYFGLKYRKNYTDIDEVYLNVNGAKITANYEFFNSSEGNNYLFVIPPTNQVANLNIKLTVKNNQNSYTNESIVRVTENRSLEIIWDKLDYNYIANSYPYIYLGKLGGFSANQIYNNTIGFRIGSYLNSLFERNSLIKSNILIDGIYGSYELKYDDLKTLKEIYVLNGEPQIFQGLTYESVVSEVSNFYGPPKSSGFDQTFKRITTFETQRFKIVVGELGSQGSPLFTKITLK
jgi:hypothetical protein